MAGPRPAELNVSVLTQLLNEGGLLTEEAQREIRIKERIIRQRLVNDHTGTGRVRYTVSAPEIVAYFEFQMPDGRRLSEDRIMEVVAGNVGLPYMKLDPLKLDGKLITETFSRPFARHNIVLPIAREGGRIVLAISDPYNQVLLDQLRRTLPMTPDFVVASKTDILKTITEVYGFRQSVDAAASEAVLKTDLGNLEQYISLKSVDQIEADDAHIVNAVEYLLLYAFAQRASDIHVEPKRENTFVRVRIDGVLHQVYQLPRAVHGPFISRLKMMARMDIAEKRRPQDGRIKTEHAGQEIELRVSSMPVAFGEKIVIRIFDPTHLLQDMGGLGMSGADLERYRSFAHRSNGMILVTGPTGSGKTTTLYSTLRYLSGPAVNITTVEDPIEMIYEPFNQVQVNTKIDVTFARALRTVLRQDPDIVMVGEIRDGETGGMAVQAALTGHLVLSTLHTNDAPSTVTRLLDLGVKPFLLASTLCGIVAQRLVRSICPDCKTLARLTDDQIAALDFQPLRQAARNKRLTIAFGRGCETCRFTGFLGRTAIFEVLPVTEDVRKLISQEADASEIRKAARANKIPTLKEAAIKAMAEKKTTFEEVVRVIGTTG